MKDDVRVNIDGRKGKNWEYRKMRRIYGINDERTQMAKLRYLQRKDGTQRLICKTLHDHNGIVMRKLNKEDVQPYKEVNEETGMKGREYQGFKWQWMYCE